MSWHSEGVAVLHAEYVHIAVVTTDQRTAHWRLCLVDRGILGKQVRVAEIPGAVARWLVLRTEAEPGAAGVGDARCTEFSLDRTRVPGNAAAQFPSVVVAVVESRRYAQCVLPFFRGDTVGRAIGETNAQFLEAAPAHPGQVRHRRPSLVEFSVAVEADRFRQVDAGAGAAIAKGR